MSLAASVLGDRAKACSSALSRTSGDKSEGNAARIERRNSSVSVVDETTIGEPGVETLLLPALSYRSVFMPPTGLPCGSLENLRIMD